MTPEQKIWFEGLEKFVSDEHNISKARRLAEHSSLFLDRLESFIVQLQREACERLGPGAFACERLRRVKMPVRISYPQLVFWELVGMYAEFPGRWDWYDYESAYNELLDRWAAVFDAQQNG